MPTAPQSIVDKVKPFVQCPNPLWQCIVQFESGFNPLIVGDNGTSYGLFQLHSGGQADAALQYINSITGYTGWQSVTYLLQNVDIQAQFGMPSINSAWQSLRGSFNPQDRSWWLNFCAMSGHPGGSTTDPTTNDYVTRFMATIVNTNTFGIQQVGPVSPNGETGSAQNNGWLQSLVNMPAHQACSIVWRRSCPGAKAALEGGIDLASPQGTPVFSLGPGSVVGAGFFWHSDGTPGYGVVTVRTITPNGLQDIYYQHINIANNIILCNQRGGQLYGNIVGPAPTYQNIQRGQFLGTVAVNETEVGFNADWGGIWGDSPHPGEWLDDPEDSIRSLMSSGGGVSSLQYNINTGSDALNGAIQTSFTNVHTAITTLGSNPGLAGPIQVFHNAQQFKGFSVPPAGGGNIPVIGGVEGALSYPTRLAIGTISFIVNNTMAFMIRSMFTIIALVIIVALIINITSKITSSEEDGDGNSLSTSQNSTLQTASKAAELAVLA